MKVQNIFDEEGNVIASELVFRFPPLKSKEDLKKFVEKIEDNLNNIFKFEED